MINKENLKIEIDYKEKFNLGYELAKEFTDRFTQKYGATCCRALNPHPFETKEHLVNCLKITGNTSKLMMEFLLEKGYLPLSNICYLPQPQSFHLLGVNY